MKTHLLIIDDDQKLNRLLKDYLSGFGYHVSAVIHPDDGLRFLRRELPDLIILDIMLPDRDGFEVCREIRKEYAVPIIMLTARGEVTDRIVGLELGADDYLPKPFEPRELLARIQSVLRRGASKVSPAVKTVGRLAVDFNKHSATLAGDTIQLTAAEFEILAVFVNNPGRVLNRDQILERMRGIEWQPFNRSVDVLISRLRQKLKDDPQHPTFIKTVWGSGYMFIDEEEADG